MLVSVITTAVDSARTRHLPTELRTIAPWATGDGPHVMVFDTPCSGYKGKSDGNECVQRNLFGNHQKCARRILASGAPFGLVLESDVQFDGALLQAHMDGVLAWAERNGGAFDILLLGGAALADPNNALNDEHVARVVEYVAFAHAIVYSRDFCKRFVRWEWPGMHFDNWIGSRRGDLRIFMSRHALATVHHRRHRTMMERYRTASGFLLASKVSKLHWIIMSFVVACAILFVMLSACVCLVLARP